MYADIHRHMMNEVGGEERCEIDRLSLSLHSVSLCGGISAARGCDTLLTIIVNYR